MSNQALADAFAPLSTPVLCDAGLRTGIPARVAPAGIRSIPPATRLAGRVLPARHAGSVDVFLEALEHAEPGDVLTVDDGGRTDVACIGDLIALECRAAGVAGIVVWGAHRDSRDLRQIGLPVFSYSAVAAGPARAVDRPSGSLVSVRFGECRAGREDVVFADEDGVIFLPADRIEELLATARSIWETERGQADAVRSGTSLREQLGFAEYLRRRSEDPSYSFRRHLRVRGGEIEE